MQHHRHSGVNEVGRILPCTCGRATLDARRILLLVSGDVERNPGPMIRGAQWNAGGLSQAKRIALERKLHEDMVLFCLLQETHLASAECAALKIGGYQHVGQARTPHGGGVSILVRDGVGVEVGILEKEVPERATVTLRFSADVSLTIISAYFPRKADVSSEALDTLLGANGAMVIGADVNSHHVLWDPLRPSDDKGECIVDWCVQNDMRIANTGLATRRQPGTAALSSPDITLCRDCEISNWKSALSPDSDHHWITFDVFVGTSLDVIAPSKPVRALYSWNKARWNEFKKLSDVFISRGMKRSAKGADALNEAVTRGTRMAAKRTIPKGKGVAPPFWTPELTKLDKMVQECKNERKRDALIRWRRKVLVDTAMGRWKENVSKLSTMDSASWNLVKSIYAPRPLTSPVLVVDGHPLTKRQQAQALAKMYMSRSTKAPHAPEMRIPSTRCSTFRPITEAELDVALRELSSGTAPGDDEIHCEELKELGRVAKKCVLRLFNCSLRTGQVPAKWKHGIIVPLLKPNKPASSMASFRPVTLTSTLCKLMERIVARRVRDCIEDKLQPQQAGFRPARSTLDTLMQVTSAVRRRRDGEKTAAVFIDYARAFDSVDHNCIVKALMSFGVEEHLVAWIADFLQGRTAQVRVNNTLSEDISLTCGVPQGSVLGPLLFIVTVDSLSKRLNCIPGLQHGFFADDLTIVCTSADLSAIQQTIQQGLDCITRWSEEHYMEVSAEKTEYTLFGARETNLLSLKVGETVLKEVRTPKLLGLTMQPHKGLSKHVQGVKAAADARLLQLRAVASPEWGPDREKLRAFYLALVQAKVCYGIASWWFDTSLSDRERLEKVQAQAAHIVAGIPKAANRNDALCEARLKPINEVAHRRALEYYLRLKAKGAVHAKIAESIFPPEHPIHVRLAKVKHLYSTIDGTGKQHDATVLQLARRVHFNTTTPGGLKADAPEKDKKMHTMRRVVRFREFDYQVWTDGSVVLDVSSGAGALVYPKEGRREKVVLGAGSLACSYRAECVAMEAGLKRLVDVIELNQTHRTRVVAFTDSLSLLMALSTGPAVVEDAILRRIWDLILRLVRLRVSVNFQFVFSHCGVPRNEAADKAAEQGNAKPQMYPAWVTDIVTGVERQVRNEMYLSFEEGRMQRTHRSVLLDHVRPAPKHTKLDRPGESLLAQFRTGTSKHFGWLHRVLTRKTDRLECRWCRAKDIGGNAVEGHTLAESAVDSANAPDFGIATRQSDPIICPLCNMVCARRQAGVVHLVKIHGLKRECALAMTKKARRAALTYKNGYTCHVCGDAFERRGLLVEHMAQHPPVVVPTVEERPKRAREEDEADNGKAFKCCWCAKRYTVYARLRKHMIQKHPEKQLKSDDIPVEQEASSDSDGEPVQEKQIFVCQKCNRVHKGKTWLTRHKCNVTSNINSEDSNVAEQSDTAACPICSKEYHYKWLLRHMREKHPGHDESLRPQPRAKPKRKTMRSEAKAQDEGSRSTELAGDGDGEGERPRKRPRMGRHKEGEEGRDYVCGRCDSAYKQWYSLVWHTRTHHDHATTVKRKVKDGTVAVTPLLQRSLQCPYCPMKCALKQYLTMHLQAKHGQRKKESEHNLLKAECEESAAHLLECPSLRELRKKHGLETRKDGEVFFSAQLASFLKELFKLESPLSPPLDSPKLTPARAVKRHRSPTALDTAHPPSAATKLIGVCPARAMRKRVREADSLDKAFYFNVPLGEARRGSRIRLTSPAGIQSHRGSRESSAARAE